MKISVFGLGYVGCVTAACLARDNHTVFGVDVNPMKVEMLRSGQSPVLEPGLDEIICEATKNGNLQVTLDSQSAVANSDITLICVGTPSNDNGSLKTEYVENVCREIGEALSIKQKYHLVVVRSTVLPGTVVNKLIPLLEQYSGLTASKDFGVCMNPEFLREGSAIDDYYHPSLIVVGELDQRSGDIMEELYSPLNVPVTRTEIRVAEMVKYTSNAYHALKVVFANEIGNLAKANGIDGQEVMKIFIQDRQLNISSTYLIPGFAFGGSCLPKDLRAILYRAKELDVDCPLLSSVLPSNHKQIENGIRLIEKTGSKKVGILGLSFKPGTDDLRESPTITLAETLIGRGYQIRIYDEKLNLSKLVGANKVYLEKELPHIASLLCSSVEQLLSISQVVVITNGSKSFLPVPKLMRNDQTLIDLVGIAKSVDGAVAEYEGICW
jgi:GDP-mannose 6-dehydrogenase